MSGLRTVREVMSPEVTTLREDDSLSIADDVMKLGRIRHMPVVDNGKMVGIVTIGDLVAARLAELSMEKSALEGMIMGH